jgi:hypothetical protein
VEGRMKLILVGMAIMLVFQFVGLTMISFEEIGIDLIVLGLKIFPFSIAALIFILGFKMFWREKDENNK